MKIKPISDKKLFLSIEQLAKELCVDRMTIYRWINWYYSDLDKPEGVYLPDYRMVGKSKMYEWEDLKHFKHFKDTLPYGAMAEYSRYLNNKKLEEGTLQKIFNTKENQAKLIN